MPPSTAATSGDRLSLGRARGADRRRRLGRLRAQRLRAPAPRSRRHLDAVQREERVERLAQPRVDRHARARPRRPAARRTPRRCPWSHSTSSRSRAPSTPCVATSRAGGGVVAELQRRDAALGGGVEACADSCARSTCAFASVSGTSSRCRAARPRLDRPSRSSSRHLAGASPAPTSRGRRSGSVRDAAEPAPLDPRRATRATSSLGISSGKRAARPRRGCATQSWTGAHHSRASQSKRRCGIPRTTSTRCAS